MKPIARTSTIALRGMDVIPIDVQVQQAHGNPCFTIVGLADKSISEARDRVRAVLQTLGISMPPHRVIVNLAPADHQKEGSHYDLPIITAILTSMGIFEAEQISHYIVLGELGLDGSLAAVPGILSAALEAHKTNRGLICPAFNGGEAAWASPNLEILAPLSILSLLNHFRGSQVLSRPLPRMEEPQKTPVDLRDVRGQGIARRALEIAAAGGHHLLLSGPPGVGKSMLASRLPSILPSLSPQEALEVTMIHSLSNLSNGSLALERPFRDPHHSASLAAMVGGGSQAKPGEISLAHCGVLFLDELPEFARPTLEALRQPLETGRAVVARANHHVTYPAKIQLVAAMNPCRCGYVTREDRACSRAPKCATDYQAKISGPILDRIDLHVSVEDVSPLDLTRLQEGEPSDIIRARVLQARERQNHRLGPDRINADLSGEALKSGSLLSSEAQSLLIRAAERFKLSARTFQRLQRVSRTIADLEGSEQIRVPHMAEALMFRGLS